MTDDHDATIERALDNLFGRELTEKEEEIARGYLRDLVAEVTEKAAEEAGKRACRAHRNRLARTVELVNALRGECDDEMRDGLCRLQYAIALEGGERAGVAAPLSDSSSEPAAPDLREAVERARNAIRASIGIPFEMESTVYTICLEAVQSGIAQGGSSDD